jgi:hypothetical protein
MMGKRLAVFWAMMALLAWAGAAHGARSFTWAQSPPTGTEFNMGSTQSVTFAITNTATGGQAGERIYELRFEITSGSVFSAATAAPAGWTRTAFSANSVTFRASSWANAIAVGSSTGFTLSITMRTAAANLTNERLRRIRAFFTNTTTGPPFTNRGNRSINNPGSWRLMSLEITSFQITDMAGTPVTAITAGSSFRLLMTIRNNSTVTQTGIVSNPNPPTAVTSGTVTEVLTGIAGSPLALVPGASGIITFTYSTAANDNGTIHFTAQARRSATVSSSVATSTPVTTGRFTASIAASPSCQYVGSNITVTMTLTVGYPHSILNVTPVLVPAAGAPIDYLAGPAPASPLASVPASPPTTAVTWTYQMNATGTTNPFTVSGSASGTGNTPGLPMLGTPVATSANVTRGSFGASLNPTVVNAGSGNIELTASITNNGCAAVDSVTITAPAGWNSAGDTYSLVDLSAVSAIETWTASGANPVVFAAPDVAGRMPLTFGGDFAVVYASTPPGPGPNAFSIRVTDINGRFADIPLNIDVNAFQSGTLNDARSKTWREDFR